jgi:hypothetical protein
MTTTTDQATIWLCGRQYPRCESTLFTGDVRCAHECGHDGLHHSGHNYWPTSEQDPITCRACGKPIHPWQDTSGSGWSHDSLYDEYLCWPPPNLDEAGDL